MRLQSKPGRRRRGANGSTKQRGAEGAEGVEKGAEGARKGAEGARNEKGNKKGS